jgi:hypothetical protein
MMSHCITELGMMIVTKTRVRATWLPTTTEGYKGTIIINLIIILGWEQYAHENFLLLAKRVSLF